MALIDSFGRAIRYLRVSVTDRCNLQCDYCRPAGEPILPTHEQLLTLEEIARLGRIFVGLGIDRIRLTGGEPLLRRNLVTLVGNLAAIPGLHELSLTTNALLLDRFALALRQAGLQRVNISLDTLDPATFFRITQGGDVLRVLAGIEAAVAAGLHPVKINMVVMRGVNDHEIPNMIAFAVQHGLVLRFIETMPVGRAGLNSAERYVSADEIVALARAGDGQEWIPVLHPKEQGSGPARYFRIPGSMAEVGIISARSRHFCDTCNRMRLTSRGELVLCLGGMDQVDLKTSMRGGATDAELAALILDAVLRKPQRHHFELGADSGSAWNMSGLGG
ncbi:MAG: GTP 3',8-cyclase MoaA [Magnetococcales bacterium]|nr:GTP 3',8-cyclase MoaA [Magnetococcales bacterium]NGZ06047.1 GTP 3',8-cyclase MoaA [Magnetococcales bacterium]